MSRVLLSHWLTQQGIARDDKDAAALIMSGRVYVNGQRARAGQQVKPQDAIQVRGLSERYVAKGGLKLEGALRAFDISAKGRVCIDAGASTGGFTHCLLTQGARLVYAVDVGYGQLAGSLRQDARVINMERTNIGDEALLALDDRLRALDRIGPCACGNRLFGFLSWLRRRLLARVFMDGGLVFGKKLAR